MKTLAEHNAERKAAYKAQQEAMEPHPNGIACPKCLTELWDSSPYVVLDGISALKDVHCTACGFRGYAFR